ncbi:Gibberellin 20-oxidase [Penicillium argentinense]|uniref:Gibberellin 20-oxidase n=1 Tax=Penicillium argentinense TaxID=1131581 RepID=A0A9W9FQ18_9EURO|nr:Gibberellin 20-oxidase [Penicillium argentinense]KAJ5103955.1 Gibberellin 20-oxidase [Penicillium argentinense]
MGPLGNPNGASADEWTALRKQLHDVFATTGFAYLINVSLTFNLAEPNVWPDESVLPARPNFETLYVEL